MIKALLGLLLIAVIFCVCFGIPDSVDDVVDDIRTIKVNTVSLIKGGKQIYNQEIKPIAERVDKIIEENQEEFS